MQCHVLHLMRSGRIPSFPAFWPLFTFSAPGVPATFASPPPFVVNPRFWALIFPSWCLVDFFHVCISFARFRLPVYLAQNWVYHVLWYLGVPWLGQLGFLVERPSAFSYWNQTWLSRFSRFVLFAAIKRLFVMTAGLTVILPRQSSPRWTCRGSAGKNKDDRETNTFCRSHKAGHGFIEQPGVERDAEG